MAERFKKRPRTIVPPPAKPAVPVPAKPTVPALAARGGDGVEEMPSAAEPTPAKPAVAVKPAVPVAVAPVSVAAKPAVPVAAKPAVAVVPAKPAVSVPPAAAVPKAVPLAPVAIPAKPATPAAPIPVKPAMPAAVPVAAGAGGDGAVEAVPPASPPAAAKPAVAVAAAPAPAAPRAPVPVPKPPGKAAAPRSTDPLIGKTVARCHIEAPIGAGKTSRVYRATHTALQTRVAVKVLQPEVLKFPQIVAKFEQEARAVARLDHPNVVKIYDVSSEGDLHCIVMELLEGEDALAVLVRETRIDVIDAMRIVRQAAGGLAAAHAKGIIHRDVKPQNLFVLPDGTVKLVDFGLATQAEGELASERIGTPHYMAPEVCEARPAETASDVYSLGITFYHLLTGAPPYAGQSIKEILQSHIAGEPLKPERKRPEISKAVCELVRAMTKRDPLTRPNVQEVIDALDRIGGAALRKKLRIRPSHALRAGSRRSNPALVGLGVGGVLVAVVLVLVLSKTPKTGPSAPGESPAIGTGPGGSSLPPTPPVPPTPGGTPGIDPSRLPPPPPPETDAERRAREKREKETKAVEALQAATEFARERFEDKSAVVLRYKAVADAFRFTEAGAEAKRRMEGIAAGTIHPHPDRTFAKKTELDSASAQLQAELPKVKTAIGAWRFDEALSLVPENIEDPTGKVGAEVAFWRGLAKDLVDFTKALKRDVPAIEEKERKAKTPKGEGTILKASETGVQVAIDADVLDFRWAELGPEETARIAKKAFGGKDIREVQALAAFAMAFRLEDAFYDVILPLKAQSGSALAGDQIDRMLGHANDEWFAKEK